VSDGVEGEIERKAQKKPNAESRCGGNWVHADRSSEERTFKNTLNSCQTADASIKTWGIRRGYRKEPERGTYFRTTAKAE